MQRLPSLSFGLLFLGAALAAGPVLAQVRGGTVAVVAPAMSSSGASRSGCTDINPCAVVTPALGSATLPIPETPSQSDSPAAPDAVAGNAAPARAAAANPACPPAGARGGQAAGRGPGGGQFGGRGGQLTDAQREAFRRFAQAGGGEAGRGFAGRGGNGGNGGNGGQGRGQGAAARGGAGCPPAPGGQGRGRGGDTAPR